MISCARRLEQIASFFFVLLSCAPLHHSNPVSVSAWVSPHRTAPQHRYFHASATCVLHPRSSLTLLFMANKLWDRLGIEEDDEPFWYLINCVATNEIDLLRQCRTVCADMADVVKFVVPVERKTRSHGANKMVTETKVKYPGYVFAKLRLCPQVYEAIQELDLCRSWMGTVNHKGHKKLPPVPVALNEVEVENFGVDKIEEENDDIDDKASEPGVDSEGIIVDSEEDYDEEYEDPMYKNIDKKALKKFKGLKVEDMIKVTAQGKFLNEDGIVRRLKEGKILVRFYTYGTMFEEWLDPSDVRKLSSDEVLKGLSGPSQPLTQRDFDAPCDRLGSNDRPDDLRGALVGGRFGERNRRQDRVADRYRSGVVNLDDISRDERKWNQYKEQQQKQQSQSPDIADTEWRMRAGSQDNSGDRIWAEGDADSQWGRKPQRQMRKEIRKTQNQLTNRQAEAAIDGKDDWSAFVSSSGKAKQSGSNAADEFFASLMTDLNKDLYPTSGHDGGKTLQQPRASPSSRLSSEDDFFASLMSEISNESPMDSDTPDRKVDRRIAPAAIDYNTDLRQDDDFFANLEAELGIALAEGVGGGPSSDDSGDFFAQLEAELVPSKTARRPMPSIDKLLSSEFTETPVNQKSSGSSASTSPTVGELSKKTVPVLKEMLRERGLKVGGTKSELVERLLNT